MYQHMDWRWTYKPPPSDFVLWRNVARVRDLPGLDWLLPDAAGNRLVYFSNSGSPQWDYQVRLGFDFSPAGVCQVSNHALWITDWRLGRIECRSAFGHLLGRAPPFPGGRGGRAPTDICATREGHLLLTDMDTSWLHRLDSQGNHLASMDLSHLSLTPSYVDSCHDNGLIAVVDAENGRAAVLDPRGQLVSFLMRDATPGGLDHPLGVRFEPGGRQLLICCDSQVARFSLHGGGQGSAAVVDSPISGSMLKPAAAADDDWKPRGLAIDPQGGRVCVAAAGAAPGRDSLHCFSWG